MRARYRPRLRPSGEVGPVLNVGRLAPSGAEYYLSTVAVEVGDYYAGRGEAPGRWIGEGARELGLAGLVDPGELRAVLGNRHPSSGEPIVGARNRRVPGFDLTFRAPKSVSLLWALGGPEVAREVREAHDAAVVAAVGFVEAEVVRSRRGRNGVEQVEVTGVVAAAFRHRTSRAKDPLVHTHVLVANCVKASDDGVWRTLDSRRLYRWSKTAGYLYQAQLRHELTVRLGVAWGPVVNGCADVAGVPRVAIEAFSTRRAQILAALDERGQDSPRAAQVAALATRTPKTADPDRASLARVWAERARAVGLDPEDVARLLGRQHVSAERASFRDLAVHLLGPDGLTAKQSTFDRRDVLQAWCQHLADGAPVAHVRALADALLDPQRQPIVALDEPAGVVVRLAAIVDDPRYSTPELLATEQRLVDGAAARVADRIARVDRTALDATLAAHPTLLASQKAMVRRLVTSGAGVEVIVGKAGSGKTCALRAARHAWDDAGVRVVGCALSARAARELEHGSNIPSTTIARMLAELDHSEHGGLRSGSVLVVDEAGMVGTRDLARLLDHAETAGAKAVLVGDHHQLPAIDAGGAFHALARRLPTIELVDNRRQQLTWERDALDHLRHGDPTAALDTYRRHGRIHLADSHDELRDQLVGDWWHTTTEHGLDAIMIAHRRVDVADLNTRAHHRMAQAGELTGPALEIAGREFRAGDRAVCLRNDPRLGTINGMRGTITAVDVDEQAVRFHPDDLPQPLNLPESYLSAGHLDHGYAITAHKAQGLTCDATFVLADDTIYREWGYVALSRGRHANHLYLTREQQLHLDGAAHPATLQPQPGLDDTLAGKLTRRRQQHLAIDQFDDRDHDVRSAAEAARRRIAATRREQGAGLERGFDISL